jgi:hypothetical protein
MTRALQKTQGVKGWVLETPPNLVAFKSDLSCQLSTHGHCHAAKDMLHTSSDCRLDPIWFLCCIAERMVASAFFVDQAFEFTEVEKFLKAFT